MKTLSSIFMGLLLTFAFSCAQDSSTEPKAFNIDGLTDEQFKGIGFSSAHVVDATQNDYRTRTATIAAEARTSVKFPDGRATAIKAGDYYHFAFTSGKVMELLEIADTRGAKIFYLKLTNVAGKSQAFILSYGVPSNDLPGNSDVNFAYKVSTLTGAELGSSSPAGQAEFKGASDIWDCTGSEFKSLCGSSIVRKLVCSAGMGACKACGLIVIIGIAGGCSW